MVHAPLGDILLFVKSLEYTTPGDIVCCDPDRIIVIRPEYAEKVYKGAKVQIEAEENKIREIEAGATHGKRALMRYLKISTARSSMVTRIDADFWISCLEKS